MKTRFLILFVLLLGCTNRQNQSTKTPVTISAEQPSAPEQPDENKIWKLMATKGDTRKSTKNSYIKTEVEGIYGNPAEVGAKLYVEVIFTKSSAGFFLHEKEKNAQLAILLDLVIIRMQNSRNEVLQIGTNYIWNEAGGILVRDVVSKRKVIDYSFTNLKNFLLNSKGEIKVEINDSSESVYRFVIDATDFETEFNKL